MSNNSSQELEQPPEMTGWATVDVPA